uniref:Dienelactone hydrolase endo-1,3,1,4-beta-D-glucanase n=1 Tax=Mycena chlorophos TaxID=658473 RepID=A0ABQ0LJR9_MYCCL|nr:dienelactone hydrolase endo-1,3,1,4-beta-D-glucanase [Mycena chlorophos]
MSSCKDCIKGVTHEGTPTGKIEQIGGVECYVATPEIDYPKDKAVLLLTDGFGIALNNNKLLADDYAVNGFKTVIPDYLNGDPVPADAMDPGKTFDFATWLGSHRTAQTRAPLDKVIAALKAEGIVSFAAVGYCFGARYVFDLAFENVIKVAATAHPSQLKVPDDFEKYKATAKAPLLVNSCTYDTEFPPEVHAKADEAMEGFAAGYKRPYWEGCTHGFAVRGDLSDPKVHSHLLAWSAFIHDAFKVKAGKEGAFKETVEWFIKYM